MKAKGGANIYTFDIPKHSPQLNWCEYFVWKQVNQMMRATKRSWLVDKKEKRADFLRRLARTAKSIPEAMVIGAGGHMNVRCERLVGAEGGHEKTKSREGCRRYPTRCMSKARVSALR